MRLRLAILLMLAAVHGGHAAHVIFNTQDLTGNALTNRRFSVDLKSAPHTNATALVMGDRRVFTTDTNGSCTVSNMHGLATYEVRFYGVGLDTMFYVRVPEGDGLYNARNLITRNVTPGANSAYSQTETDARFVARTNGGATNLTVTNLVLPGSLSGPGITNAVQFLVRPGTNITFTTNGGVMAVDADALGRAVTNYAATLSTNSTNFTVASSNALRALLGTAAYSNASQFYPASNPSNFITAASVGASTGYVNSATNALWLSLGTAAQSNAAQFYPASNPSNFITSADIGATTTYVNSATNALWLSLGTAAQSNAAQFYPSSNPSNFISQSAVDTASNALATVSATNAANTVIVSNRVVSLEGATNNLDIRALTNAANIVLVSNRVVSLEGATNNLNTRVQTNAANILLVSNRVVSLEGATNALSVSSATNAANIVIVSNRVVALEGATNALSASKLDATNGTARGTLTAGGHLVVTSNLTVNGAVAIASNLTTTEISSGLAIEPFEAKNLTIRAAGGDMFKGGDLYLLAGGAAEAEPGNVIIRGGIVPDSYMTGSVFIASDLVQTNGNSVFQGLSAHTLGIGTSEWNSNSLASGIGVFSLQSGLASLSPTLLFQRSRSGGAAALTNDLLGLISGRGYGGETFRQAGGIAIRAGADFSETNSPGVVEILAAATNSSALSTVGRFSAGQAELTGNLILNGTNIATVFSDVSNRVVSLEGATNNLNTRALTNAANIVIVSNRVVALEGATNNLNTRALTNAANIVLVSNRVVALEGATNNLNTRALTNAANIVLVSNRVVSLEGATNNLNTRALTNAANIVIVSNRVVSLEGATNALDASKLAVTNGTARGTLTAGGHLAVTSNLTVNGTSTFNGTILHTNGSSIWRGGTVSANAGNLTNGNYWTPSLFTASLSNSTAIGQTTLAGTNNVSGSFGFQRRDMATLANGANILDPSTNTLLKLSGNTSAAAIHGISGGWNGRVLRLLYNTAAPITLANNSGVDPTAANRILTGTGADVTFTNLPTVLELSYDSSVSRWILDGFNALTAATGGDVTQAGNNTFTGTNAFNAPATFNNGITVTAPEDEVENAVVLTFDGSSLDGPSPFFGFRDGRFYFSDTVYIGDPVDYLNGIQADGINGVKVLGGLTAERFFYFKNKVTNSCTLSMPYGFTEVDASQGDIEIKISASDISRDARTMTVLLKRVDNTTNSVAISEEQPTGMIDGMPFINLHPRCGVQIASFDGANLESSLDNKQCLPTWLDERVPGTLLGLACAAPKKADAYPGAPYKVPLFDAGEAADFTITTMRRLAVTNVWFPELTYTPALLVKLTATPTAGQTNVTFAVRYRIATQGGTFGSLLSTTNTLTLEATNTLYRLDFGIVTNNALSGVSGAVIEGGLERLTGGDGDITDDVVTVESLLFTMPFEVPLGSQNRTGD